MWDLKPLRNYLYGISDLEIHTDHQPLSFAISEKNPNIPEKEGEELHIDIFFAQKLKLL